MKFGWCLTGHHKLCRRKIQKWQWDAKMKNIIMLDEWSYCSCKAKGCPCKENDVEAKAPVKRKRKK